MAHIIPTERKLLKPLVLIFACIAVIFTSWVGYRTQQSIYNGYKRKITTISSTFANGISDDILSISSQQLTHAAASMIRDPDLSGVVIFNINGDILSEIFEEENLIQKFPKEQTPASITSTLSQKSGLFIEEKAFFAATGVSYATKNQIVGGVVIYMSRQQEEKLTRLALTSTAFLGISIFLLSMIPIYFLVRSYDKNTEALAKLNKELESANQLREQFLANMSHEIRTPMNSIIGYTELLQDSIKEKEQKEWLSVIQHNGDQLLHLINQILNLSKLENKKFDLHPRAFEIHLVLNQVANSFRHICEKQNLILQLDIRPEVPKQITADPDAIIQCLNNLLSNAVKFTETGSIGLSCRFDHAEDLEKESLLSIKVTDTGRGIPEEKRATIFDPFSQIKTEDNHFFNGTGLGLSITHSIVKLMEGEIILESAEGKGSCFEIRLPIRCINEPSTEVVDSQTNQAVQSPESDILTLSNLPPFNVIVAEDNTFNQKLILRILAKLGIHADLANNGKELLESIERKPYDLILMDINMPDVDGLEATKRIREGTHTRDTYIVAVSASANDSFVRKCYDAGVNDFLGKPFRKQDLANMLSMFSERRNTISGS